MLLYISYLVTDLRPSPTFAFFLTLKYVHDDPSYSKILFHPIGRLPELSELERNSVELPHSPPSYMHTRTHRF